MTTEENGSETTGAEGSIPPGGTPGGDMAGGTPGPAPAAGGGRGLKIGLALAVAAAVCAIVLYKATTGKNRGPAPSPPLFSVAELNTVAPDLKTVFLYVPGTDNAPLSKEAGEMLSAVEKNLLGKGVRTARFTLPPGSPDYASFAANMALPGIAVLTKGKGAGVVSGAVSESALMKAYEASIGEGGPPPTDAAPPGKGP